MTTLKDVTLKHNLFLSCLSPSQPSLLGELMCAVNHQSNGRCFDFWLLWPICQSLGQCSSNCVIRMLTVASHGQRCNQHNSTVCWLLQPCDAVIIRVFFHAALKNMTMRKEQQFPVEDKCLHTVVGPVQRVVFACVLLPWHSEWEPEAHIQDLLLLERRCEGSISGWQCCTNKHLHRYGIALKTNKM